MLYFAGLVLEFPTKEDFEWIEPLIDSALEEYSSDYALGSQIIISCIESLSKFEKQISKVHKIKDILRKSKGLVIANKKNVFECGIVKDLVKADPNLNEDLKKINDAGDVEYLILI